MEWKDATSWRRGEERTVPRAWEAMAGGLRIVVTRMHFDTSQAEWYLTCHDIGVREHLLGRIDEADAKAKGLEFVRARLAKWLAAVEPTTDLQRPDA